MSSPTLPKAILYSFKNSVWCSVPALALQEKGYGPDEIDVKEVDLTKGEQLTLTFLRLNPAGTVPTLVVPLESSLAPDEENRFRALRDTATIADFLDQSRSPLSRTQTTSSAPAPSLSPATIEGSTTSKAIIALLHDVKGADPNFLKRSARTPAELAAIATPNKAMFAARQRVIDQSLSELGEGGSSRTRTFLEAKSAANQTMISIWNDPTGELPATKDFFESSKTLWESLLPDAFKTLEETMVGPYCLGDQLSIADLHLAAWLARVVSVSGGQANAADLKKVEEKIGTGFKIGEKIHMFWAAIILRPSFRVVYKDGKLH